MGTVFGVVGLKDDASGGDVIEVGLEECDCSCFQTPILEEHVNEQNLH